MAENRDVFDFALEADALAAIVKLDNKVSSFFSHRDPAMVKRIGERKMDV
jgi:diketogulonate reductase-like aldo/keto reductase